ncbi:MAG: trans-sulfuration enzyme family protein [Phycisphaerales bacterium]
MRPGTMVIHAGQSPEPTTGAVMPPIFTSSTYAQESPGVHKGMDYIRAHNPTRFALERMVAALEGSEVSPDEDITCGGFAFASGMASIGTALELLDAGDHIVTMDDLYGGTNRLLNRVRARTQGLQVTMADLSKPNAVAEAMHGRTKMVWVETPSNPTLKICDLDAVARAARAVNPDVILACDNTFATPINQKPLEHGFDIVMHSATKYLGGHSDVLGGLLVARRPDLAERLRFLQLSVGAVMGPFDAYMTLRGIKTLDVRMQRHNESAARIANFLEEHPKVDTVVYPGLESHPAHAIATRQMRGFGGMITIFLKGDLNTARAFLEKVKVFALAESLGGVESLIEHPAIMTHASVPPEQRTALGISDTLVRLSVGVEDCDDLIADLEQALG